MIKKILPISIFVLVLVFVILLGLQNMLSNNKSQGTSSITPTLFQGQQKSGFFPQTNNSSSPSITSGGQLTPEEFQKKLPIVAPDFTLGYSSRMQRYVVTVQNDDAKNSYNNLIGQNPAYANELQNVIITKQSVQELNAALDYAEKNKLSPAQQAEKDAQAFTSSINTLINLPFLFSQSLDSSPFSLPSSPKPTPTSSVVTPTPKKQSSNPFPSKSYTYYSQCGGPYDSSPLPLGCTMCAAGCGPTSIAMILSSYIDSSLTPPKVVDLMSKNGVHMGCGGSSIYELYSYLQGRGDLKVSDFIIPSEKLLSANDVASDFKGYIKSGWTVFVLANFKTDGGGHYFWVTDVNDNGDILSYDPYYGRGQTPPISENNYTPAPYYRYAFAIKKA